RPLGEVIAEIPDVEFREQAIRPDALPLAVVHVRGAVLGDRRFGARERREVPVRRPELSELVVADNGVLLRRPEWLLRREVVVVALIRRASVRNAENVLVDGEMVVGAEEP